MTNSREVAHYPRVPGRPRSRLTGINPRHFSKPAWYRFSRDRRARYVFGGNLEVYYAVAEESARSDHQ